MLEANYSIANLCLQCFLEESGLFSTKFIHLLFLKDNDVHFLKKLIRFGIFSKWRQGTVLCLPQTASADMARFIEIVMGVGIAAGTVIEDFGTGGVGIADDLASFLIAQKLILGYWEGWE